MPKNNKNIAQGGRCFHVNEIVLASREWPGASETAKCNGNLTSQFPFRANFRSVGAAMRLEEFLAE